MALDLSTGKPTSYTAATTVTTITGSGDFLFVSWPSASEGSGNTLTVYIGHAFADGDSASGTGELVRVESALNGKADPIPVRGAKLAIAASSAWGTATLRLGSL